MSLGKGGAPSLGPEPWIATDRLFLRRWRASDLPAFASLNADPTVMEYLPSPLTAEESDEMAARIEAGFESRGFGFWAVEVADGAPFIGFVGLSVPRLDAPFMPAVEIGWRLASEYWGRGYATEAACAALGFGFDALGLEEIVAFTTLGNVRSQRVMERVGMTRDTGGDFEHPALPVGHVLRPHVLYRVTASEHRARICGERGQGGT